MEVVRAPLLLVAERTLLVGDPVILPQCVGNCLDDANGTGFSDWTTTIRSTRLKRNKFATDFSYKVVCFFIRRHRSLIGPHEEDEVNRHHRCPATSLLHSVYGQRYTDKSIIHCITYTGCQPCKGHHMSRSPHKFATLPTLFAER